MSRAMLLRMLLPAIIGAALLLYLLDRYDLKAALSVIKSIDLRFFAAATGIGALSHFVNGIRISKCLPRKVDRYLPTAISMVHILSLNIMPFRSGELSFWLLVRKYTINSTTESISALTIQRVWDIVILSCLCIISCIISALYIKKLLAITIVAATGSVIIIITGLLFLRIGPVAFDIALRRFNILFLENRLFSFMNHLDLFKRRIKKSVTEGTALFSFIYWALVILQTWLFFISFIPTGIREYIVLFTIINIWAVLPIHGFLSIGTAECALIYLITSLGFDAPTAMGTALGFRLLVLVSAALFGLAGTAALWLFPLVSGKQHQNVSGGEPHDRSNA